MLQLPNELIKTIVTYDNETWIKCCHLSKYFLQFNDQDELKLKFLRSDMKNCYKICYFLPNGLLHNYDKPSVLLCDDLEFYKNGKLHRDNDLPAKILTNGGSLWYKNGDRHRDNDLPAYIDVNGNKHYYIKGRYIGSE